MVRTFAANVVLKRFNDCDAGPLTTVPLVLYWDPWQGHWKVELPNSLTVQASCVHTAVIALKVS